jgi:hypothetical protein
MWRMTAGKTCEVSDVHPRWGPAAEKDWQGGPAAITSTGGRADQWCAQIECTSWGREVSHDVKAVRGSRRGYRCAEAKGGGGLLSGP